MEIVLLFMIFFFAVVCVVIRAIYFIQSWNWIFAVFLVLGAIAVAALFNELRDQDPIAHAKHMQEISAREGVTVRQ